MAADEGVRGVVGASVRELGAAVASERAAAEGEQLELIGLPASLAEDRRAVAIASADAARRGRPAGSQNKATEAFRDYVRRVLGFDPMVDGARWLQHTPESLAIALGCSKLDAFDRLERMRAELMPYFYARLAPIDGDTGKAVPMFLMQVGNATIGAPGGMDPPWKYPGGPALEAVAQTEQNQGLGEAAAAVSHGAPSHGEPK